MKLHIEYHRIEIISGGLRPIRSQSQPEADAPIRRIHKVSVKTAVTAVSGTWNSYEIGTMISRKIVKSKASSVHPSQAATRRTIGPCSALSTTGLGFRFQRSTPYGIPPGLFSTLPPIVDGRPQSRFRFFAAFANMA